MKELERVTITLLPAFADILRQVCEEWIEDHSRFSNATKHMCTIVLRTILAEIDSQVPKGKPEEPPKTRRGRPKQS